MAVLPGATLGILGGGQLGRMFALDAKRMSYRVAVLEPSKDSPCGQIADHVITAPYTDEKGLRELADKSDVLTYEFENVDAKAVEFLEGLGKPVHPSSKVLRITQDRILEKTFALNANIPVTAFAAIRSGEDLENGMTAVGFPAFLKTSRGGYDGKGQVRVADANEAIRAFESLGEVACVPSTRMSSADCAALRISAFSLRITAAGVRAGARMPFHSEKFMFLTPASANVGVSEKYSMRCVLVTAIGVRRPALTCAATVPTPLKAICTCPASRSTVTGAAPL